MLPATEVEGRLARANVPGAAIAVVTDGELSAVGAYGLADPRIPRSVVPDTVFQACSLSKPVTALGVLVLVDRGIVGLDDDVEPLVGLPLRRHDLAGDVANGEVTIRRLLGHRGGIIGRDTTPDSAGNGYRPGGGGSYRLPDLPGVPLPSLEDCWFGRRGSRPAVAVTHPPGDRVSYSGAGFLVLQRLVEQVTGMGFDPWMRANVLAPLGASRSYFSVRSARRRWSAVGHDRHGDAIAGERELLPWSAAGGLYSTAPDLARVVEELVGPPSLVAAELMADLVRDQLGVFVTRAGRRDETLSHGGSNSGFRSLFMAYPNQRRGVVVLTNGVSFDGERLRLDLARLALRDVGVDVDVDEPTA